MRSIMRSCGVSRNRNRIRSASMLRSRSVSSSIVRSRSRSSAIIRRIRRRSSRAIIRSIVRIRIVTIRSGRIMMCCMASRRRVTASA